MQTPEQLDQKRRAYQAAFNNPMGAEVLNDLHNFCRINKKSFEMGMGQLELAYAAGLRDVYLRIQNHLNLTDDDIWQLTQQHKKEESEYE